jgi:hypothetical protein
MGVGMKGDIDDAVAVFGGKTNEIGKQHQPVPQPAGSQPDDEDFVISRPHGFRKLTDCFGTNLPGWPRIWQAFIKISRAADKGNHARCPADRPFAGLAPMDKCRFFKLV